MKIGDRVTGYDKGYFQVVGFSTMYGLKYFPDTDVYERLKMFLNEKDSDIEKAAEKSMKKIENRNDR